MNAMMDGTGPAGAAQTWPLATAAGVTAVPLPAEAKARPHPSPLPQAGEGAVSSHLPPAGEGEGSSPVPQAGGEARSSSGPSSDASAVLLPLPLAGEDWGEGKPGASEPQVASIPAKASPFANTTSTQAAPASFGTPQTGAGMVGTTVVTLLLVIGFILLLGWLAKRMPGLGGANNPALKVVGSLALGPRDRVVVVAVGDTQLLLATGPGGTRTLHTLEQPLPMPANTPSPFAQVLAQQFGKKPS